MKELWNDVIDSCERRSSALVVGLDPDPTKIPENRRDIPYGIHEFLSEIICATSDIVCAYKLNIAFYLALYSDGVDILRAIMHRIPDDVPTILDCKFGDVGHTAQRYAYFVKEVVGARYVTLNPYIGRDAIAPFVEADVGVFLLCATSNPSYADVEMLNVDGVPLYEKVARLSADWSEQFGVRFGLVVGATHPELFNSLRKVVPSAPFLVPGIGAQGGKLMDAVKYGFTNDRFPPLIVSARSILYASAGEDFAEAARAEAKKLRDAINNVGGFRG